MSPKHILSKMFETNREKIIRTILKLGSLRNNRRKTIKEFNSEFTDALASILSIDSIAFPIAIKEFSI
jgi:hypothetical protein